MSKKIVTLGEIMLRLSPEGQDRFIQSESFRIIPGGGEANVAISCANYGHEAYFVSKLPKHEIGQMAINAMRRYGVNTQFIARGGERVGLYYCETGASMRPSKVIYDRAHSSIAEANPSDFDFDAIMQGADWFHWSGITPAISDKAAEITKLACEAAKRHGVTVSVDLNFRKKLWTSEKAISIMRPLMQYVDVCIGNEEDAELCLGFKPDADVEGGETNAEGYKGIFEQMMKEFGFKYVVSTLRESYSATFNGWKAMIYNGEEFYESKRYEINPIIDRVGGGDSFSGGLIHGLLTKPTQGEALEFAVAASALKHTINGDFNLVSVEEVESLAGGMLFFLRRLGTYESPIEFMNLSVTEHCIQTLKCLGCLCQDGYAADRTVKAMRQTDEDLTRLCISLSYEGFVFFAQRFVTGLVTLNNFAHPLVHHKKMVVFIKNPRCQILIFLARQCPVYHHMAGL